MFGALSIWQMALIIAMALAFVVGRPHRVLACVVASNFAVSAYFGEGLSSVMVADLLCVALLIGRGPTEDFIALLFALMIPFYVPAIIGVWNVGSTFAIVEAITYLQYAVIGGLGGGFISRRFRRRYRRIRDMGIDPHGGYAAQVDFLVNWPSRLRG